jgi:hypothetical protein
MMTSLPAAPAQPAGLFDAVLRKPFTPDLLLETMRRLLARPAQYAPERSPNSERSDKLDPR